MKLMSWRGASVIVAIDKASNDAVREAAEHVLAKANEHVPYMTGRLESTGVVSTDGSEAAISYDTVYAAKLHQHPEFHFQGQGRGRWLQEAVEEDQRGTLDAMAAPLRKVF